MEPTIPVLNQVASKVELAEIRSPDMQRLIDRMLELAAGKGKSENDSRFPDRIPLDRPERLHWVEPQEFEEYRTKWEHWPKLCSRATWETMKGSAPE